MTFLLLMNPRCLEVVEIDGGIRAPFQRERPGSEATGNRGVAAGCPARYTATATEGRELALRGYDVYRTGGHEIVRSRSY
ncbi:hypothetical protein ACFC1L_42225 [Streptomyces sp. NPDC056210]|uniref:hypothetical protein n=1 Tax=unclassified Streptomyces TaxID=2593676 RepID=UPI0035D8F4FA